MVASFAQPFVFDSKHLAERLFRIDDRRKSVRVALALLELADPATHRSGLLVALSRWSDQQLERESLAQIVRVAFVALSLEPAGSARNRTRLEARLGVMALVPEGFLRTAIELFTESLATWIDERRRQRTAQSSFEAVSRRAREIVRQSAGQVHFATAFARAADELRRGRL